MTLNVVGLSGYARSGKDTAGSILVADHGYERASFADKLREVALAIDPLILVAQFKGWTRWKAVLQGKPVSRPLRLSAVVSEFGWEVAKEAFPEVRRLLQRLGTEAGRNLIDDNLWVNLLTDTFVEGTSYVITDVRFPNEAEAVRDLGGVVLRVERTGFGPTNPHPSETALDDWPFDAVIVNDGTVTDLKLQIGAVAERLKRVHSGVAQVAG